MSKPELPQNQVDLAYLELERLIVTLVLASGTIVPERELISRLGLGRTPIREAIQRLSWEGLLEIRPRSGIMIAEIHPVDYARVIDLRLILEPRLAKAATRFATNSHRDVISQCRTLMLKSKETGDTELFLQADKAFDTVMSDAAGNNYLTSILGPLQTHSRRFWYCYHASRGVDWSADGHIAVMDAILNSDFDVAQSRMEELMKGMLSRALELAL